MIRKLLCNRNIGHHWVASVNKDGEFRRSAVTAERLIRTLSAGPGGCPSAPTSRIQIAVITSYERLPGGLETTVPATLLCKLNLHHEWHFEHTDDGDLYKRCLRCGKDGYGGDGASDGWALKRWW